MTDSVIEKVPAPEGAPAPKCTYWLTRNRTDGKLADMIEVWVFEPELLKFEDGDAMWIGCLAALDKVQTYHGDWTISRCLKECRTYPDDERQSIRVG